MTYVALEGVDRARARARGRVDAAVTALAGLASAADLEALARYVVERDR
jgi:hypothetical protein